MPEVSFACRSCKYPPFSLSPATALLCTARYPQGLFDFVVGINRWMIRVQAYASLMRDEYPPFRLDQGAREENAKRPEGEPL